MKRLLLALSVCLGMCCSVFGMDANAADTNAKINISAAPENIFNTPGCYELCIVSDSEPQAKVLIKAKETLKDVKILSLRVEDFVDDTPVAKASELNRIPTLTRNKPLILSLVFIGDSPTTGISFVDKNGEKHIYGINISGMDGSFVLEKIALR